MTQQQLSEKTSVTREQLSNYENGKNAAPAQVVVEIAEALGTEFSIRGYRITRSDVKRLPEQTKAAQLCLDLDKEHQFTDATLKIRPTTRSIQISAVLRRRSSSA